MKEKYILHPVSRIVHHMSSALGKDKKHGGTFVHVVQVNNSSALGNLNELAE